MIQKMEENKISDTEAFKKERRFLIPLSVLLMIPFVITLVSLMYIDSSKLRLSYFAVLFPLTLLWVFAVRSFFTPKVSFYLISFYSILYLILSSLLLLHVYDCSIFPPKPPVFSETSSPFAEWIDPKSKACSFSKELLGMLFHVGVMLFPLTFVSFIFGKRIKRFRPNKWIKFMILLMWFILSFFLLMPFLIIGIIF